MSFAALDSSLTFKVHSNDFHMLRANLLRSLSAHLQHDG
jgi:hypothetical protein